MMAAIRRLLGLKPAATFLEVAPAARDPVIEERIREAKTALVKDAMASERRGWRIRQDLAADVLEIISGDR